MESLDGMKGPQPLGTLNNCRAAEEQLGGPEPQFFSTLATQLLHLVPQKQVEVQPQLLLLLERLETNLHAACP